MEIYELTRPLSVTAAVPDYLESPTLTPIWRHSIEGISIQRLGVATHHGTHMDAPLHFLLEGASVDLIPLSRCIGPGIVLDIPCDTPRVITVDDIEKASQDAGGIRDGDRILIRTGWEERYATPEYTTWPYLDVEAVEWLMDNGISLLGTDTQGVDQPPQLRAKGVFRFPVHKRLLGAGIPVVEGLANLYQVAGRRLTVGLIPLLLVNGDGSPVRAFAWDAE